MHFLYNISRMLHMYQNSNNPPLILHSSKHKQANLQHEWVIDTTSNSQPTQKQAHETPNTYTRNYVHATKPAYQNLKK